MDPNLSASQFGMSGSLGSSGQPSVMGAGSGGLPPSPAGGSASGAGMGMGGSC